MLRRTLLAILALLFAGSGFSILAQNPDTTAQVAARNFLNEGVRAFKDGQFERASELFKRASELDPTLINARLYLATAYASQYIPGTPSEENRKVGEMAIGEFHEVLKVEANNLAAIDGIASTLYNMGGSPYDPKKFEESREFHKLHIKLKPDDADPYYWVGVVNWTLAFRANNKLRSEYNLNAQVAIDDIDPLPDKLAAHFATLYQDIVDEGINHLEKSIRLKPDYEAAYAYMNLLYRQKADMATSKIERETILAKADNLVEKYKEIKQKKIKERETKPEKP